ncbi:MAG TPA: hypothetical protein GX713_03180 [Mollicutes bacterium]|nr:hypothetical protein [Mollicutes bacterium]
MKKIILIILILLTSGCYNYKEVDDLALVSSLAINYIDNNFEVIIEVEENNKDDKYQSHLLKGIGSTIESAMENTSISLNKELYFINLDALLLSTDVVNEKLDQVLDFIIRDNNFSFDYNVIICDKSQEVIESIINTDEIFGTYIQNVYENTNNNLVNIKIYKLLDIFLNDYQDIILPIFDFEEDLILINRAAIFSKNKIVNYLDSKEIALYNILNNNYMNYYLDFNLENKKATFKGNNYITKSIYQNNTINIFTRLEGSLVETENIDVKNKNDLDKINNEFKKSINNFILKLYQNNSDILGFKNKIHKKNKNIDSTLTNIKYNINTKTIIDDDSLILESIGK